MLTGGVRGRAEIDHLKVLLGIVPEQLRKELAKGTREALAPLKKEIPASAITHMPARHGYGALLARATKVAIRVSASNVTGVSASVTVSAKGKSEDRDVRARNRGEMRHPTFGRRVNRKGESLWRLTRVRPGFVDEPVKVAERRVTEKAEDARDKIADMLLRE